MCPCQFCGKKDSDGDLFWECTFPPFLHVRELPEFAPLMSVDRSRWPRCLLWHGLLPGLGSGDWRSSWAASFRQLACLDLERRLGAYPVGSSGQWTPLHYWDADDIGLEMSDHPNIRTGGSREDFSSVGGFEVAGAGVYLPAAEVAFESARYGELQKSMVMHVWSVCRAFYASSWGNADCSACLNSGVLLLPCRRTGLAIWVLITLMLPGL